jgi:hypothetical protein
MPEGLLPLSQRPNNRAHPRRRVQVPAMQIGDILTHDGRRHVVRGFDPEGVSPRLIYLEDLATGAPSVLSFEHVRLPAERKLRRLRLVRKPNSKDAS